MASVSVVPQLPHERMLFIQQQQQQLLPSRIHLASIMIKCRDRALFLPESLAKSHFNNNCCCCVHLLVGRTCCPVVVVVLPASNWSQWWWWHKLANNDDSLLSQRTHMSVVGSWLSVSVDLAWEGRRTHTNSCSRHHQLCVFVLVA